MKKKSLLIAVSFGLFSSIGFSQNLAVNKANENFKQTIKNGFEKDEPLNPKNTGVFIPEWRENHLYNQVDEEFNLASRNQYSYQNSNQLVEDLSENFNATSQDFEPSFKILHSESGNWKITHNENWDSGDEVWYGSFADSTEYNTQGDAIYNVQWYYDVNAEEWVLSSKSSNNITYNLDGDFETVIISVNDANGDLQLSERENYIYDANGVLIEAIFESWDDIQEEWELNMRGINPVWLDQDEFLFTYVELEEWDGNDWQPYARLTSSYHADDSPESELEEYWDDITEEYVNDYFYERDIDANLVETSSIAYNWDGVTEEWAIYWGNTYTNTYNTDDELEEQITVYWNSWDEEWVTNMKYIYSYIDIASISNITKQMVNIYPNPSSDFISIDGENSLNHVSIIGMNGQVVYFMNNINSNNHKVDIQNLNAGTYFVAIKNSAGVSTSKLIVH